MSNASSTAPCSLVLLAALAALAGCKQDPPDIADCPPEGESGEACQDTDADPPPAECANPDFSGTHPPATEYECVGRAGGALVFNQVIIVVNGDEKGGPGCNQTNPAVTEFPGMEDNASACCHGTPTQQQIEDACEFDCGRAACNRILDDLRDRVADMDPSGGKCDDLKVENWINDCRTRVRNSIQGWIDQLEVRYDECVEKAAFADDPDLDYCDPQTPFSDDTKLVFTDSGCNQNAAGCLFQAELRPFCEIDSTNTQMSCSAAGNQPDPNADGGMDPDTTGGGGGVVDPFGDVGSLISCSPQTTCTIHDELKFNVETNMWVFYDEGVVFTLGTYATGVTLSHPLI